MKVQVHTINVYYPLLVACSFLSFFLYSLKYRKKVFDMRDAFSMKAKWMTCSTGGAIPTFLPSEQRLSLCGNTNRNDYKRNCWSRDQWPCVNTSVIPAMVRSRGTATHAMPLWFSPTGDTSRKGKVKCYERNRWNLVRFVAIKIYRKRDRQRRNRKLSRV